MTEEKRKTATVLTPAQWAEAEALWRSGEVTLEDLARRFDIRRETLSRHFARNKVVKGSEAAEHARHVADKLREKALGDRMVIVDRIRETKESHYKWSDALAKLAMQALVTAQKKGMPLSTTLNDLKAVHRAAAIVQIARNERWAVLGLDKDVVDEDSLPDLIIHELTPEQIKAMQEAHDADDLGFDLAGVEDTTGDEEADGDDV